MAGINFDPANPPDGGLGRFQNTSVKMYNKLINRNDQETAEELRSIDSPSEQTRFIRQQVVEFDPKHDEDVYNSVRMRVQNVYNALVALGYDDRAEELRDCLTAREANVEGNKIIDEIDAEIDPVTGEYEAADGDEATEAAAD